MESIGSGGFDRGSVRENAFWRELSDCRIIASTWNSQNRPDSDFALKVLNRRGDRHDHVDRVVVLALMRPSAIHHRNKSRAVFWNFKSKGGICDGVVEL